MKGGATLPKGPKAVALARKLHLIFHDGFSGKFQPCLGAPREEVGVTSVLRQRQRGEMVVLVWRWSLALQVRPSEASLSLSLLDILASRGL